jgi:hypothetical protein
LTTEALAARADATRLRMETRELKLVVRGNLARSRKRLDRAVVEANRAQAWRDVPLPSPWSDLRWTRSLDALEKTLVPLP